MRTAAELKRDGMIIVERGWITLRGGRRLEDTLYQTKESAERTAKCLGATAAPAKRVWSVFRRRPEWIIGDAA